MNLENHNNINNLQNELNWLSICVNTRMALTLKKESQFKSLEEIPLQKVNSENSTFGKFVNDNNLNFAERFVLFLSLVHHIKPNYFKSLHLENNPASIFQTRNGQFLPTVETALYILAGDNLKQRLSLSYLFETDSVFYKEGVIDIGAVDDGAPIQSGILKLSSSFITLFTLNKYRKPRFSIDFPAHLLTTKLNWNDLVLNISNREKVEEIKAYLEYNETLKNKWGLKKHLKPGYRCLFYGPSGTGKTLTATLLGKYINTDVYRVDLSSIISKYIGETSKNLRNLFDNAEDKGWILFFDEGDALFGKRSTSSGRDKNHQYANQDIAYLLQRIEDYKGLVIVATNLKNNVDEAFNRRFENTICFEIPDEKNRLKIWTENMPKVLPLEEGINLELIAKRHKLSTASIFNIINRLSLLTLHHKNKHIQNDLLNKCIRDEEMKQ